MIRDEDLPELPRFRRAEQTIPIHEDSSFGSLVVATDTDDLPVHRWFRLKESFSPHLLDTIIDQLYPKRPKSLSLLDPFSGVGTALVSAQLLPDVAIEATGIERNPFIAFAAKTKLRWHEISPKQLLTDADRVLKNAEEHAHTPIPALTSISTGRCISLYKTKKLIAIRDAIERARLGVQGDALLLGLAAAIEPLSKIRRDGRALRIVERQPTRVIPTLKARWQNIADDCKATAFAHPQRRIPTLLQGDGRQPQKLGILPSSVDLVLTSPPYPNNIDYSEVYKLELWMLGFIKDDVEFLGLRRQTFRSHPTCADPAPTQDFTDAIARGTLKNTLHPILERAEDDRARFRVFKGYFSDLWTTMKNVFTVLRPGGHAVFVVGNSLHGTRNGAYLLPTDLVIAQMAAPLGYKVASTIIARNLRRRLTGNHFLRESLVILQRPHGNQRQASV